MCKGRRRFRSVIQWAHIALSQVPSDGYGVYAFWCRDTGKCIYVGKAKDRPIRDRLRDHWRGSHNLILSLWIQVFGDNLDVCYKSADASKIDVLERRLIRAWSPEANIQHNRR